MSDALKMGFGEPVAISAETGEGMAELYNLIQPHIDAKLVGAKSQHLLPQAPQVKGVKEGAGSGEIEPQTMRVAIMGLPNVVSGEPQRAEMISFAC